MGKTQDSLDIRNDNNQDQETNQSIYIPNTGMPFSGTTKLRLTSPSMMQSPAEMSFPRLRQTRIFDSTPDNYNLMSNDEKPGEILAQDHSNLYNTLQSQIVTQNRTIMQELSLNF